eukprot:1146110-Pelagomonas_calceolata.AAC.15
MDNKVRFKTETQERACPATWASMKIMDNKVRFKTGTQERACPATWAGCPPLGNVPFPPHCPLFLFWAP